MAENEKITTSLEVDVSDFKKGLSDANRAIRLANSEFDNATAGIGKWSDSADGLRAKLTQLNKTLDAQEDAASILRAEYERVVAEQGENSKGAQELAIKLNKQEAACKKTAAQIAKYEGELEDLDSAADDVADSVKDAGDASDGLGSKLGGVLKSGLLAVAAAATAAIGALIGSAEATREYRTAIGKLDTAFEAAGHSSATAEKTYKALQGVLGETDQAVEAASHLAKLTKNEKDLQKWTNIATGVYGTFGASLPIEGLTEAANETAKTGALTGGLADALNWAGVSEDAFQEKLDACNSEQERATLITETLNGLYSDAADKYRENNAEIIRANEANEEWQATMAGIGEVIEPILTDIKLLGAALVGDLLPGVKKIAEAFRGLLNGEAGAAAALGEALAGIITQLVGKVTELAPTLVNAAMSLLTNLSTSLLGMLPKLVDVCLELATSVVNQLAAQLPTLLPAILSAAFGVIDQLLMNIPALVSALQAVIDGVIAALPRMLGLLCDRIPEIIIELLYNAVPALLEAAFQMLTAIVQAVPMIVEQLAQMLPTIIDCILFGLIENIPVLLDGALKLLHAIVDAIPLLISSLVAALPDIIDTIMAAVTDAVPALLDAAIELLFAIIDAIPVLLDSLVKALPKIIDTIVGAVIKALPVLLDAAVKLLLAIVQAIPKIIPVLVQQLPTIISTITGTLLKNLPLLINAAIKLFFGIIEAIPKIVVELGRQLPSIIKAIVKGLGQGVKNIASVGKDLIMGLWNGIKDMTGWITGKLKSFGDTVLGGIKSFFGIKSPSKVMAKEVGRWLPAGLAEGVTKNTKPAIKAMAKMAKDALGAANAELNGAKLNATIGAAAVGMTGAAGGTTNIFNQYNYSPKALNRAEIYRQTKNQLRFAKANA